MLIFGLDLPAAQFVEVDIDLIVPSLLQSVSLGWQRASSVNLDFVFIPQDQQVRSTQTWKWSRMGAVRAAVTAA